MMGRILVLGLLVCGHRFAVETAIQADERLPVKAGLELWLDATRADSQANEESREAEEALARWEDVSGNKRHLVQAKEDQQPRLIRTQTPGGKNPVVRFDGQKTSLLLAGPGKSYRDLTLFVVASPRTNAGGFRALLAFNKRGVNDYTSGLTVDLSAWLTFRFNVINLEGIGFGGAADLMGDDHPLGTFHVIGATLQPGKAGVKLFVDGKLSGSRDRTEGELRADELRLGVRHYSNTAQPTFDQGYLDGDIAEVLLYDRVLTDDERKQVEKYLAGKHAELLKLPPAAATKEGKPLVAVKDPPPVQMHVPGFVVEELPVDLTNVNNLRYRPDGKLVAVAYDGNIYLLADKDGDGLEEDARLIWDNSQGSLRGPIGAALTPPEYPHGSGLFVAAKGKVSLLTDTDGDDVLDNERVVASGWKELPHGVDTLGVAIAKDGGVFFGLGCADYTNGYLLDKEGKSHFDLASERGTIMRIAPDLKSREVWCTGIRYSVGMAMNAAGDLFCTDQEGATWLANGNPLDELLHIQKGRHYGFPPRHPKHLPRVIDEPSTFDYAPQHQSTCGLCFNEPPGGGPAFGPEAWRGDALVTGYSRGKLYRTKLVKGAGGYVAQNQLLATLNMLAAECCVGPRGELLVAAHSGGPDWGSGPGGKGKLYKINYANKTIPQPALAWCNGEQEVRIAFDKPLDPGRLQGLRDRVSIEFGRYVAAADRFESLRPGYAVVQQQMVEPRYELKVHGVFLTPDQRTLVLSTDRHQAGMSYAVTLPRGVVGDDSSAKNGELKQLSDIDLAYRPDGIRVRWRAKERPASAAGPWDWDGVIPHFNLDVARALTRGSADHDRLWQLMQHEGEGELTTNLDLCQMLQPRTQPGSALDHQWPKEDVRIHIDSSADYRLKVGDSTVPRPAGESSFVSAEVWKGDTGIEKLAIITFAGKEPPRLNVLFSTAEDQRVRPLPLLRLSWLGFEAKTAAGEKPSLPAVPTELAGGDWLRGRNIFYAEQAQCAKCHAIDGKGGTIGPNLSNLRHRDYASVVRDITQPSFALNPDYLTYNVLLEDGRQVSGVVLSAGDKLRIGDAKANELLVSREEISAMKPQSISTMPEGLPKELGAEKLKDLLTFLLLAPPAELQPAPINRPGAPPPRKRKDVEALLKDSEKIDPAKLRPLTIVLVAGPKDHGENEHDYPDWQKRWSKLLPLAPRVKVESADSWPTAEQLKTADVMVFYSANPAWSPEKAKELDAFQARGGGAVLLHYAVNGQRAPDQLAERIGLAWQGGKSKFRHGALDLKFITETKHPILRNFQKAHFEDESYWDLLGDEKAVTVLATGEEDGQPRPLLWTYEHGKGKVFCSILGHYSWTFDDPYFRTLVLRGIAWTAGENVDRFNDIVLLGARVEE